MDYIKFRKMHGLGNDFVIIDNRINKFPEEPNLIKLLSDRKTGIGFDQLVLIEESFDVADIKMKIFNSDGSEAETCGNASRCVGKIFLKEKKLNTALIETAGGILDVEEEKNGSVKVDMGIVRLDWRDIPLSVAKDTSNIGLSFKYLKGGVTINIGNPHLIFFVDIDLKKKLFEQECLEISNLNLFPKGINISIAKIISNDYLELLVFERGCGFTRACGSGACATLVAANILGLTDKKAVISMPGGKLDIEFLNDQHVTMAGPVKTIYEGKFSLIDYI